MSRKPGEGSIAGWLFAASRSDADNLCQRELPFDMIYPAGSPLAKGKSAEEQREAHYRGCMAIRGYADEPPR